MKLEVPLALSVPLNCSRKKEFDYMTIYRGPGGTGEATTDTDVTEIRNIANEVVASAAAAAQEVIDTFVYPPAGVVVSTGTTWGTSKASPAGVIVGTTDTQTLTNKTLTSPSVNTPAITGGTASGLVLNNGYTEEVFAITDDTTVNLDPNNGSIQTWTLGANRTPGQTNWAAGQSITLMIDDGSARTITWSTLGVVWETNSGSAPTLATSGFTVIVLWKVGTTIYGARVGDA
jgi:hypothetical protein